MKKGVGENNNNARLNSNYQIFINEKYFTCNCTLLVAN